MEELKGRLDKVRPLTKEQVEKLRPMWAAEETRYVYATNAMEGNTLTLSETQVVLEQGVTVGGKPLKDHIDAVNGSRLGSIFSVSLINANHYTHAACSTFIK